VPLSAGTRLRPYQIVAMIGAGEMGDGQSALSEGIPSIGHTGFHIDVESHP
jgi:hypothetical protein